MKKRLIIILLVVALIIISMPFALIFLNLDFKIYYAVSVLIAMVYLGIYTFVGLPRFIIYSVYGIAVFLLILLLPRYRDAIALIGSLMFLINPLSKFEQYLDKIFSNDETFPIRITIRGRYWPFFSYRKNMQEQYYLPQAKKIFTKTWYLRLRQALMLLLAFTGTYVFIVELQDVTFNLTDYNLNQMITFYNVAALFIMTFILYKKGFTALLRISIALFFIPTVYLIFQSSVALHMKFIFSSVILVIAVIYLWYEKSNSLQRVLYQTYEYYDSDMQAQVYANALYEPLVYNEVYALVSIYEIPVSGSKFDRSFHNILYYANRKHFLITAYTVSDKKITLYTDFFNGHAKRTKAFKKFLEELFDVNVQMNATFDLSKEIYESNFFHKSSYIVARTLSLAELLIELEVETEIIISMVFSFKNFDDMKLMAREYQVTRIPELDDQDYYAVRVSAKSLNRRHDIDSKVRDMLLTGMIYQGQYVRVLVYY